MSDEQEQPQDEEADEDTALQAMYEKMRAEVSSESDVGETASDASNDAEEASDTAGEVPEANQYESMDDIDFGKLLSEREAIQRGDVTDWDQHPGDDLSDQMFDLIYLASEPDRLDVRVALAEQAGVPVGMVSADQVDAAMKHVQERRQKVAAEKARFNDYN